MRANARGLFLLGDGRRDSTASPARGSRLGGEAGGERHADQGVTTILPPRSGGGHLLVGATTRRWAVAGDVLAGDAAAGLFADGTATVTTAVGPRLRGASSPVLPATTGGLDSADCYTHSGFLTLRPLG